MAWLKVTKFSAVPSNSCYYTPPLEHSDALYRPPPFLYKFQRFVRSLVNHLRTNSRWFLESRNLSSHWERLTPSLTLAHISCITAFEIKQYVMQHFSFLMSWWLRDFSGTVLCYHVYQVSFSTLIQHYLLPFNIFFFALRLRKRITTRIDF